jgi:hypothetical protein
MAALVPALEAQLVVTDEKGPAKRGSQQPEEKVMELLI